jgi:hypothetical protein
MSAELADFIDNDLCHTVSPLDHWLSWRKCYRNVLWAKQTGIRSGKKEEFYGRYDLSWNSSIAEFQAVLWSKAQDLVHKDGEGWNCPKPCNVSVVKQGSLSAPITNESEVVRIQANKTEASSGIAFWKQWWVLALIGTALLLLVGGALSLACKSRRKRGIRRNVDVEASRSRYSSQVASDAEAPNVASEAPVVVSTIEPVATTSASLPSYWQGEAGPKSMMPQVGLTPPVGLMVYASPIPLVPVHASTTFETLDQRLSTTIQSFGTHESSYVSAEESSLLS